VAATAAPLAASASVPLVAAPFVVKVLATAALVVGVGAGGVAYRARTDAARAPTSAAAPVVAAAVREPAAARPSPSQVRAPRAAEAPIAIAAAPLAPAAVVSAPSAPARPAVQEPWVPARPAPPASQESPAAVASSALAEDVRSLREAQAALVAGNPVKAIEAAGRMQASGPLAEEREGVRILASCSLRTSDARDQAASFVARHPEAPIALRVRAACLDER
jgi:hypothetical protein